MHGFAAWQAIAAYLYVLGLDDPAMAWEYLRRNADYRAAWRRRRGVPDDWGLTAWEDPRRDARGADPLWRQLDLPMRIVPAMPPAGPFGFWRLPGIKRILHDGARLRVTSWIAGTPRRFAISPQLAEAAPHAYQLDAGFEAEPSRRAALATIAALERPAPARARAARRDAIVRMRILAALDGEDAGASHREIGAALFGEARVASRWSADGELRAQVRYLLARGHALVAGDYRALIAPPGGSGGAS
ncbi:DUF2285 domain-containing protein [Sphingomonas sp. BT-65]|uniref:DUF2285 domain-containing protein n=1 Tax=Sphingomonas sp. BT-65 TaxID=2989821 RepID=UPI0022360C99|nr:DUF2285 domain-containing protein [Sphingomonas sp. BT-65]MCW4460798.1 DUF2285 domain-containing protein [Sphingomonas sp. BT-65]